MSKKVVPVHFDFPKPTGIYTVGMKSLYLIDRNRKESYTPTANTFREFMVTAWYPTDNKESGRQPYAPAYLMDALKGYLRPFEGISENDLAELDTIRVPVTSDAPVSQQEQVFPLIIFSHGYYGSRFYYSCLFQELASHGYIVIAIDHTYDAGITELPGGRLVSWAPLTDAPETSDAFYETFNTRLAIRVADIVFLLDSIEKRTDPLLAHIDITKVGIFGHSFGAEAALQAVAHDKRIQAMALMDLFPVGQSIKGARHVPCLSLEAERTDWTKFECSQAMHAHIAEHAKEAKERSDYHLLLKGADHMVFSDFALLNSMDLFKKLPQGSMFSIGSIDGLTAIKTIQAYLVAFFDKTLKNTPSHMLDGLINKSNKINDCLARKRLNHEEPAAIAERGWRYHHLGIPYTKPRPGEKHYAHLKVYVSGFDTSPYGIEWMRFEKDCPVQDIVRNIPHIAFEVDDLDQALEGKEILLEPGTPSGGVRSAMIMHDGAPIELIEFSKTDK